MRRSLGGSKGFTERMEGGFLLVIATHILEESQQFRQYRLIDMPYLLLNAILRALP